MNGQTGEVIGGAMSGAAQGTMISPGVGTIIGAGLGLVGGLIGGSKANKRQIEAEKRAREWEAYMSGTAHEREAIDLERAGLNRILTATGGPGAATPNVGMQTFDNYEADAIGTAADTAGTVASAKQATAMLDSIDASAKKMRAETKTEDDLRDPRWRSLISTQELQDAQTRDTNNAAYLKNLQRENVQQDLRNLQDQGSILKNQMRITSASAKRAEHMSEMDEGELGSALRWVERFRNLIFGGGKNE